MDAQVVLLPTPTEEQIWAYFDSTAMPPQAVVEQVLSVLSSEGALSVVELESMVNLRRGRLEALLKILDVEGAVEREGSKWMCTGRSWHYDTERYEQLAESRHSEQQAMRSYQQLSGCRLRFLREQLDDPDPVDCGRCDYCTERSGTAFSESVLTDTSLSENASDQAAAVQFLQDVTVVIEPRKQWPRGLADRSGNIAATSRSQVGRALAFGNDPGWSEIVAPLFSQPDQPPTEQLLAALAAVLKAWSWQQRPTWITWIPSRTRPALVEGIARGLGALGKLQVIAAVQRMQLDALPQARMENSASQAANVISAFSFGAVSGQDLPDGPCLVVDDSLRSGWTMTVVAEGLLAAGATEVLPLVLWRRP
ncbi:MAG: phosphoribosyltransferase [Microthrixaceae bacterium]